jgi:hypothetical protein
VGVDCCGLRGERLGLAALPCEPRFVEAISHRSCGGDTAEALDRYATRRGA